MLRLAWSGYSGVLYRRPLATKVATSATLFLVGDILSQQTTASMSKLTSHEAVRPSSYRQGLDWKRSLRMMAFGAVCHAPFLHWFWGALERAIPGRTAARVVSKVFIDQTIGASAFYALMYHFLALLEGRTLAQGNADYREKYWPTMKACWHVWPVVHLVNFSLVPLHYRVLTSNLVNLGWLAVLSFLANGADMRKQPTNDQQIGSSSKNGNGDATAAPVATGDRPATLVVGNRTLTK